MIIFVALLQTRYNRSISELWDGSLLLTFSWQTIHSTIRPNILFRGRKSRARRWLFKLKKIGKTLWQEKNSKALYSAVIVSKPYRHLQREIIILVLQFCLEDSELCQSWALQKALERPRLPHYFPVLLLAHRCIKICSKSPLSGNVQVSCDSPETMDQASCRTAKKMCLFDTVHWLMKFHLFKVYEYVLLSYRKAPLQLTETSATCSCSLQLSTTYV